MNFGSKDMTQEGEEGAQKCIRCCKVFPTAQQLIQHSLVHNNMRKYPCTYCDKSFKQLSHIQQHLRIHTGERPYSCVVENCSKSFRQLSSLQQHLKGHTIETGEKQSASLPPTNSNEPAKEQVKKETPTLRRPHDYTCQVCEKVCGNDQRFFRHMHKHHPDFWRVFSAGLPLQDFFLSAVAESGRGGKEKPFLCSICHKRYIHRTGYIKHMANHATTSSNAPSKQSRVIKAESTERSECTVCQRIFSKDAHLLRHMEMKLDAKHSAAVRQMNKQHANSASWTSQPSYQAPPPVTYPHDVIQSNQLHSTTDNSPRGHIYPLTFANTESAYYPVAQGPSSSSSFYPFALTRGETTLPERPYYCNTFLSPPIPDDLHRPYFPNYLPPTFDYLAPPSSAFYSPQQQQQQPLQHGSSSLQPLGSYESTFAVPVTFGCSIAYSSDPRYWAKRQYRAIPRLWEHD